MRRPIILTRIVVIVVAALLALPTGQFDSSVEAKRRPRSVTRTFRNPSAIDLPLAQTSPASSSLYPSPIEVSGLKGRIRDVNVVLTGFSHTFSTDAEVLLVGPRGQTAIVMAFTGGDNATAATLRLDDEAREAIPFTGSLQSGTYRPTNNRDGPIAFNAPAPSAGANAALSVFDGTDPNGTWSLFVQDFFGPTSAGAFAGGWELEITTKAKAKKKR